MQKIPLHKRSTHFIHALASKTRIFSRMVLRPKPNTFHRQSSSQPEGTSSKEGLILKPGFLIFVVRPLDNPLIIVKNHPTGSQGTFPSTRSTRDKTSTFRSLFPCAPRLPSANPRGSSSNQKSCYRGVDSRVSRRASIQKTPNRNQFGPGFCPEASRHVIMCAHEMITRVQRT